MGDMSAPVLRCESCGREYALDALVWRCACGGVVDVRETAIFPKEQLAERPMNFWRYREGLALPDDAPRISLGEVMTPLLKTRFRDWEVSLKLEYLLPTGSYKDRGIAVCINHLFGLGVERISEDSSGNAGASTAAYAAAAGMHAEVYAPEGSSPAKVNQIRVYGAQCHLVPGSRTESAAAAQRTRECVHYIGHSWNPFFACGIKSIAYEIAEQSGWRTPDWVITPAGGGSVVLGLIDGFTELLAAGYVQKMPRILAVQSAACAPIYEAWLRDEPGVAGVEPRRTYAEGVALPNPPRGTQVLQAIRRHDGVMLAVDDTELLSCWREMARSGVFIEPTSAVAVAGAWCAKETKDLINPRDSVVLLITGHGLKTSPALMNSDVD